MKRLFAVACIIAIVVGALTSCGGGGGVNNAVTTTVGNATIQKTFQPNVVQFPDNAGITVISPGVLQVSAPPTGFGTNSVFTWMDHPYVVTSVKPVSGSAAIVITTRDAAINEVLSQLIVTGDISINDADLSRMIIVTPESQPTSMAGAAAVQHAATTAHTIGSCKGEIGDPSQGGGTTISCTVSEAIQDVPGFVMSTTLGVKDILFAGVRFNLQTGQQTISSTTFTPYISIAAQIEGEPNKPGEVKGDWFIAEIKEPIPTTLGLLSIGVPLYVS